MRPSRSRSSFAKRKTSNSSVDRQPSRPQTSLGFTGSTDQLPLAGFDVRGYFRNHGSAAELTVGVNGRPSTDTAVQNYIQDCRTEALLSELQLDYDELGEEEDPAGEMLALAWRDELDSHSTAGPQKLFPAKSMQAPLCWDTLLHEKEVSVRVPHRIKKRPQTTIVRQSETPTVVASQKHRNSFTQTLLMCPHMISYGKDCITDRKTAHLHLDIHIPNEKARESRVKAVGQDSLSQSCQLQLVPELLPALLSCETGPAYRSDPESLLCIWFEIHHNKWLEIEVLHKCFDLSLNSQKGGTKAFTDLQLHRVTPTVCVLAVDGIGRQDLIGTEVSLSYNGSTIFSHPTSLSSSSSDVMHQHEDTEVPARFFFKRESTEFEHLEDEDITDLRDIAQKYPDLHVLDIDGPVADEERWRIEEVDGSRRGEERGMVRESEGEVPQFQQPAVFITVRNDSAPFTDSNSSYTSIVKQHLAQYLQ